MFSSLARNVALHALRPVFIPWGRDNSVSSENLAVIHLAYVRILHEYIWTIMSPYTNHIL